jgi:uncharacterized damage-inducible protein DinB
MDHDVTTTRPDTLQRMYQHMAWADQRTLSALRAMAEPPSQAMDMFAHVLEAEHVWLCRVEGREPTYGVWQSLGLDECERLANANRAGYLELVATGDRDRVIAYRTLAGVPHETPLEDILIHVSHHGMYHRGQVALMMRASGGTPPSTDYIVFSREALHAT